MPTHLQVTPCPQKQIVRKYVQDVPCPRVKGKKKPGVPCPSLDKCKRPSKQIEEVVCSSVKKQPSCCPSKQPEKPLKCAPPTCPGRERKMMTQACPKCESNRIQKLECEVYQLRKEIENMKYERREAEKALQKAILRGAQALGGRLKPMIPESIERLFDTCHSGTSSQSSMSLTICAAKALSPAIHPCQNNNNNSNNQVCHSNGNKAKRKEEFDYCEGCNH